MRPEYVLKRLRNIQISFYSDGLGDPTFVTLYSILDLVLTFVAGLLFGLAIKKGAVAFVLALVGFIIAGYVGLTFIPKVSLTYEFHKIIGLLSAYVGEFQFGALALTLSVIIFLAGLAIGIWKG
jgi:hypothetical protein